MVGDDIRLLMSNGFDYLLFMESDYYFGYRPYDLTMHALATIDSEFNDKLQMGGPHWVRVTHTKDELTGLFLKADGHRQFTTPQDWLRVAHQMRLNGYPK